MNIVFKIVGVTVIAVILCLFIAKQNKDIAALISIAACCGILLCAGYYLDSVLIFVEHLKSVGNLNTGFIEILIKSVGIGLVTEITSLICVDAGNAALGKAVQILGTSCILWTALPLFSGLLDLITNILGEA